MSITTAITNSAKQEFLQGIHLAADVYKLVLIKPGAAGTYDRHTTNAGTPGTGAPTTANLGTDEASGAGYTSGGLVLTGYNVALTIDSPAPGQDTASIDWADAVWTGASLSADGALIVNATRANRVLQVISFADTGTIPVTSTNANFTVPLPSTGVGQIRFA